MENVKHKLGILRPIGKIGVCGRCVRLGSFCRVRVLRQPTEPWSVTAVSHDDEFTIAYPATAEVSRRLGTKKPGLRVGWGTDRAAWSGGFCFWYNANPLIRRLSSFGHNEKGEKVRSAFGIPARRGAQQTRHFSGGYNGRMCGRYTQHHSTNQLVERFAIERMLFDVQPRYNIAPTQMAPVVMVDGGRMVLRGLRWGLVPSWADDPAIGSRMINARRETLASKPSFKRAFAARRCLIPADGFYEWRKEGDGSKTPMYVTLADAEAGAGGLFGFAGLWETWVDADGQPLDTFTIVTTGANKLLKPIHERMPVILDRSSESAWLDPMCSDPDELSKYLVACPQEGLQVYSVSRRVNKPANDDPTCVEPFNSTLF